MHPDQPHIDIHGLSLVGFSQEFLAADVLTSVLPLLDDSPQCCAKGLLAISSLVREFPAACQVARRHGMALRLTEIIQRDNAGFKVLRRVFAAKSHFTPSWMCQFCSELRVYFNPGNLCSYSTTSVQTILMIGLLLWTN